MFNLTTLNLVRFLIEERPNLRECEQDALAVSAIKAWNHSDFWCINYIINGLADSLYIGYIKKKTAKELWESLLRDFEDRISKKPRFQGECYNCDKTGHILSNVIKGISQDVSNLDLSN